MFGGENKQYFKDIINLGGQNLMQKVVIKNY